MNNTGLIGIAILGSTLALAGLIILWVYRQKQIVKWIKGNISVIRRRMFGLSNKEFVEDMSYFAARKILISKLEDNKDVRDSHIEYIKDLIDKLNADNHIISTMPPEKLAKRIYNHVYGLK